jgi:Mn2+/Fe2+ NRAMP family transporter
LRTKVEKDGVPFAIRVARHWTSPGAPLRGLLTFLGPRLITGASDDDPSGIATYSQVGAQFGYGMTWVMVFSYRLMAAIQEISACIGRVTGRGIAGNIRPHHPVWLLRLIVSLLIIANIINLGADLEAMGDALYLLIGAPRTSTSCYSQAFAPALRFSHAMNVTFRS